jgi:hypothetical protein
VVADPRRALGGGRQGGGFQTADADLNWANWCHGDPGPLRVGLTLPGGVGAVESPFDGPPGYAYVPGCTASGRPSTVTFLGWFAGTSRQ